MKNVRAAVMVEPGRIEIRTFEPPEVAEDSLLMRVNQTGICGSDQHMYLGHSALKFPVIPGHEVVGVVEEIGSKANDRMNVIGGPIQVGDTITVVPGSRGCGRCYFCLHVPHRPTLCPNRTVYGFAHCEAPPHLTGAFAEYMYVHGRSWVFRIPETVPEAYRVLVEPAAVATRAVERAFAPGIPQIGAGFGIGDSVAVIGSGPIGLMTVAVLRYLGAGKVVVTDRASDRLEMARRFGADVVLDVSTTSLEERMQAVFDLTDGIGVDIVIESAGAPIAFKEAIDLVRRAGKVIEVGHYTDPGPVEIRPHLICRKDIDILGVWAYPALQFGTALDFLARTHAPLDALVTHRVSLDRIEEGIQMLGKPGVLKVMMEPWA